MICEKCIDKPVVRGIKTVKCLKCGDIVTTSSNYINICQKCSNKLLLCECCGKKIEKLSNKGFSITCNDCGSENCQPNAFLYLECNDCGQSENNQSIIINKLAQNCSKT